MDTQCEHDQLARQCLLCEQAAEKALRGEGGVMSEQTNIEDLLYEIEWLRADNTRLRELVVNVRNKEDIWCPPIPLPIAKEE